MLTISDFLAGVDPKILERGKGYFADGAVQDLAADGDLWTAEVEGSEDYTVELRVNGKGEIASWNCDCPYEYGDVCKHVVAVCYAVQKQREKPKPKKPPTTKTFDALLDKISAEECKEFIRRHAAADKNKNFRTKFEIAFSGKDKSIDLETKYRELIRKIIRRYADHGYCDYAASNALGHEITQILDRDGAAMQAEGNFAGMFSLAKACVKELIKTIGACDDSNGKIGDSLVSAISLLRNVAESPNVVMDLKEAMFAFLHGELPDSEYWLFAV